MWTIFFHFMLFGETLVLKSNVWRWLIRFHLYFVTKKKKSKNWFKDFDSKDKDNNDMLSAYKDAPENKGERKRSKRSREKDWTSSRRCHLGR